MIDDIALVTVNPPNQQSQAALQNILESGAVSRDVDAAKINRGIVLSVLASSRFVVRVCQREFGLFEQLLAGTTPKPDEYIEQLTAIFLSSQNEADTISNLRGFRNRELARIAWCDLANTISMEEVFSTTSALAEAIIDETLKYLHPQMCEQWGTPCNATGEVQQLVVLGMGKLGGLELNFSSDIDLIFAFAENGETRFDDGRSGKTLDNTAFFTRLGQRLIKMLSEVTAEGFVYRVDMRLRPFGDAGALASSFNALETYYQAHGREWERYALIKARVVAGDRAAGDQLLTLLRPFVYRRYLDYGAIESLRELKAKISLEVARKGMRDNIKLGPGGIREIEFIGQVFQLIRGGQNAALQTRSIVDALTKLADIGLVETAEVTELLSAYWFLRRLENRLQMVNDEQVHTLPDDPDALAVMAASMGFSGVEKFSAALAIHRQNVERLFESVFHVESCETSESSGPMAAVWDRIAEDDATPEAFELAGFAQPGVAFERVQTFRRSRFVHNLSTRARARLDAVMPIALEGVVDCVNPDATLNRLLSLLRAIAGRSVYIAVMLEAPGVLTRLLGLLSASAWAADFITRHPLVIDELLNPDPGNIRCERALYELEAREAVARLPDDDLGERMDALRRYKQSRVLHIVSADLQGSLTLMQVSDQLTWLAEALLQVISDGLWDELVLKHGRPACVVDGKSVRPGFGIVAYGKLGGIELGYGSDLDIVFLHESEGEKQVTDGDVPIDNATFFARLAQKLVHFISTLTPAGALYEVDTRLRPNGASGLLVSSIDAFMDYQREQAWTWEHQALVRGQMVVGSDRLRRRFARTRAEILRLPRDRAQLAGEVAGMRARMHRELTKGTNELFDIKQDRGGVADIEFMVQYLVLGWAYENPSLVEYTDNIRLLEAVGEAGIVAREQTEQLAQCYLALRESLHRLVLQGQATVAPRDDINRGIEYNIVNIWQTLLPEGDDSGGLGKETGGQ